MVIILPVGLNVVADRLNTDIKRDILSWPLVSSTAGTRSIVNEETIYIHTYIHSYEFTHLGCAHSAEIDAASTSTIFIFTLSSEPSNFRSVLFEGSENSMLKPAFCTYIHYINQYLIHSTYIHTFTPSPALTAETSSSSTRTALVSVAVAITSCTSTFGLSLPSSEARLFPAIHAYIHTYTYKILSTSQ